MALAERVTDSRTFTITLPTAPPPNGNGEPPPPPPAEFPWILLASLISGLFLAALGSRT